MKSICLSLAAAATIGLVIAAPVSTAVASGHARAPAPAVVAPPRVVVPDKAIQLPPKPTAGKRTQKKVYSLAQIPASMRARIRPVIQKIAVAGGRPAASLPSGLELDLTCNNNWFAFWEEDENGDKVPGTTVVSCDGEKVSIPD